MGEWPEVRSRRGRETIAKWENRMVVFVYVIVVFVIIIMIKVQSTADAAHHEDDPQW